MAQTKAAAAASVLAERARVRVLEAELSQMRADRDEALHLMRNLQQIATRALALGDADASDGVRVD